MSKALSRAGIVGIGCASIGCLGIFAVFVVAIIGAIVGGAGVVDTAAPPSSSATPLTSSSPAPASPTTTPTPTAAPGTALAALAKLEVKGRSPKTGYDRNLFAWKEDTDSNGCDTRNDVLRRDLKNITLGHSSAGCKVIEGSVDDPYQGKAFDLVREPNNTDIDHIVSLSNAWQTGASDFNSDTLVKFGNDPLNLVAVATDINREKGDADAATWLPPNKEYRCEYVARQIAVKEKYGLWVVKPEKSAMEGVLSKCANTKVFSSKAAWPDPGEGDNAVVEDSPAPEPEPEVPESAEAPEAPEEPDPEPESDSEYYENCTAARAAGAAPLRRGDPGYGPHLDRDGDGVACET